jgi:hypothetical protein
MTAAVFRILLYGNFHLYIGGGAIAPNNSPSGACDEGSDLDAMAPLFTLVVIVCVEVYRGDAEQAYPRPLTHKGVSIAVHHRSGAIASSAMESSVS